LTVSLFAVGLLASPLLALASSPPYPQERPLKVAVLVPASGTDQGWNQAGVEGVLLLQDKWHLTVEVGENLGYGDISPVLRDLAGKGFDLIIAHASGYQTVAPEVAKERGVRVAVVENPDGVVPGLVSSYEGKAQEGAYMAGVIAAMMTRSKIVGVVTSAEVPDWNRMTVGFMEGLYSVNPNIRFLYAVIGEAAYEDAAGAKRNTEAQIAAGADVIFGMGNGATFGMMSACEENRARDGGKVWFIDVIGDKSEIDTEGILLGSVLWRFDIIYEMMLIDIYTGHFGKKYYQTLENHGIELAVYQDLPGEIIAAIREAEKAIVSGKIKVPDIPGTREMRDHMRKLF
ncbi:BMP family protein, partial [Candidatus Aerophobetes bacterium]|nr:BMP family protein [Candidatus Aerophobetes bacterium]